MDKMRAPNPLRTTQIFHIEWNKQKITLSFSSKFLLIDPYNSKLSNLFLVTSVLFFLTIFRRKYIWYLQKEWKSIRKYPAGQHPGNLWSNSSHGKASKDFMKHKSQVIWYLEAQVALCCLLLHCRWVPCRVLGSWDRQEVRSRGTGAIHKIGKNKEEICLITSVIKMKLEVSIYSEKK